MDPFSCVWIPDPVPVLGSGSGSLWLVPSVGSGSLLFDPDPTVLVRTLVCWIRIPFADPDPTVLVRIQLC